MVTTGAFADDDYYRALAAAERASATADSARALREIEHALQKYRGDYQLTLTRAQLELRLMRLAEAEQSFRAAAQISGGAVAARVGLGWTLVQQHACSEALQEFAAVLAQSDDPAARRGIAACQPRAGMHGSAWLSAGGALFHDHPWKRRFADASAGLSLQPSTAMSLGLAYHFLRVTPTDRRVAEVDQQELYMQAGAATGAVRVLGHAAMVWSADPRTDGSAHGGLSARYLSLGQALEEFSLELTASRYPEMWIGRLGTSLRVVMGTWSITPGVSLTKLQQEILSAFSVSLGKSFGALSLWASGKYGPEYRAAYLSQFALLNSEDRSVWSLSAGLLASLDAGWSLVVGYLFLNMRTPDNLEARMHLLNVSVVYSF
ncbi:MAG TPA: hypothetical protein VFN67_38210 [Polyangiales bacterium]|nr:hypothetical protein [Polyangiales bacterium]